LSNSFLKGEHMSHPIVKYLGPDEVTFGFIAAEKYFRNQEVSFSPVETHGRICDSVWDRGKDTVYGVVAVENRIDGVVSESVRGVHKAARHGVKVCGETVVPVRHYLLNRSGRMEDVMDVYSHPKAINQCDRFLRDLYERKIPVHPTESTGKAAQMAQTQQNVAAIASERAESLYQLKRVAPESIADDEYNVTRFWILSREDAEPTGNDKTAILLDDLDRDGSGILAKSLAFFSNFSLSVIYPIPVPRTDWEYTFLIEVRAHQTDEGFKRAYDRFEQSGLSRNPWILGSFPAATVKRAV
jgi:chorismate mutase / prephenate dehydratase